MWDPATYLRHATERGRPFAELVARIGAERPRTVIDLGCGPGQLTASLRSRWPDARIIGVDSSAAMLAAPEADAARAEGVQLVQGDVRSWRPDEPADVVLTNAALQWVPDHLALLPEMLTSVAPGGWFALQVPGNFAEPSHTLLRDLASSPQWRGALGGLRWPASHEPVEYLTVLAAAGWRADAWETTYLQVLAGEDAVLDWVRGSALRPVLVALEPDRSADFQAEYAARLRQAYPRRAYGTVLPYRRVFAVGQAPS